jgi:glycosyltransferase involved in cell wall biosynthesis
MSDPRVQPALPLGVNVAGYLDATLGLGTAARNVVDALRAAGVSVAPLVIASDAPRELDPAHPPVAAEEPVHPVTIVCVNPDGMEGARDQLGDAAFADRHVIGMWWWEVDVMPQRWMRAFDLVDEVWVGSSFVADALAAISPVPVVHVPLPVPRPVAAPAGRSELGLPEDTFLFGFVYDYRSVAARKNPLGLVQAFRRAFDGSRSGDDVGLVLKTLDGAGSDEHAAVVAAADGDPRIMFVDANMPAAEKNALIRELDCYVSLHRSEGFGLTIAEAMILGTPVIATDYGGSRDFATAFNALLVDHRPVPIGPGSEPYPADATWAEPDLGHAAALMREAVDDHEAMHVRAMRARSDLAEHHAPEAAGRAMADRLARVLTLPLDGSGTPQALDLKGVRERMAREPEPGDGTRDGPRAALRDAALRAMRPYTVHQRLVDEELLRVLQTLDERVQGLAAAQQALAVEVARLRDEVSGRE